MIKHVVMWKFRKGEEEKAEQFLTGLEGLFGVIPEIKSMKIHRNIIEGGFDAMLEADFETVEDVFRYKKDPRHVAVASICADIREGRANVDYEY